MIRALLLAGAVVSLWLMPLALHNALGFRQPYKPLWAELLADARATRKNRQERRADAAKDRHRGRGA